MHIFPALSSISAGVFSINVMVIWIVLTSDFTKKVLLLSEVILSDLFRDNYFLAVALFPASYNDFVLKK